MTFVGGRGGAIWSENPTTLNNVTMTGNGGTEFGSVADFGGAIAIEGDGPLVISTGTLSGNSANRGGAVYTVGDSTWTSVTCSNNTAGIGDRGLGGCFYNSSADMTMTTSTVTGNEALDPFNDGDSQGGGGWNLGSSSDATLTLNKCTFHDNSAEVGGGLYNEGSEPLN